MILSLMSNGSGIEICGDDQTFDCCSVYAEYGSEQCLVEGFVEVRFKR